MPIEYHASLNLLDPLGPIWAFAGLGLPLPFTVQECVVMTVMWKNLAQERIWWSNFVLAVPNVWIILSGLVGDSI